MSTCMKALCRHVTKMNHRGCGTVPLPPCGVVGVWYGMLGMYGVYGRSGMACLENMVCLESMVCLVCMVGMVCMA